MINRLLKHPKSVIIVILAVTLFLGIQIPKIQINNEVDIFLPEDNRSKIGYNDVKETFGSQIIMDVAVKAKKGTILTPDNLMLIRELTEEFEDLENVEEVTSLINADFIEGTAEGMTVKPLTDNFTGSDDEVSELKRKLASWKEMYELNLVSIDYTSTQIIIKLDTYSEADQKEIIYHQIKQILAERSNKDVEYYLAGDPVVVVLFEEYMKSDIARLVPFVILVVLLTLFICFKTPGGVILPIITVIISTIWTIGLMAMFGIYFSILTTTLPVFLIAIGSAYGIHLINDYYEELRIDRHDFTKDEHREIIFASIHKVGKPIILAAVTTLVGFGSLATSPIIPLKHFSFFSCIGVAAALIVTMTLIPSLLLVRKHALNEKKAATKSKIDKLFTYLAEAVERKKILIFIIAAAVIILSVVGISKVVVDNILIANFKKTEDIRVADKMIRSDFGGTKIFNVIIDGEEKGSMTDPEILKAMDELDSYLEDNFENVGKVISFTDFIKRMNKVMNYPELETHQTDNSYEDISESSSFFSSEDSTESSFFDEGEASFFEEEDTANFSELNTAEDVSVNNPVIDYAAMQNEKITAFAFMEMLAEKLSDAETTDPYAEDIINSFFADYNFKGESYNEIPYDISKYPVESKEELKNLISQYLLLYSGSLESYSDDAIEPSKALMVVQLKTMNTVPVKEMSKIILDYTNQNFPEGYKVSIAGYADMENALTTLITKSQISSLILSLILVFVIVAFAFRSPVAGLFGVIPLSFAILINFAVMGFAGINLDMVTAMIASIAIGIGIDYTIHFLSSYKHERLLSEDIQEVTVKTMLSTGKAILFNAAAVAAGFLVLTFSNFTTLRYIGLLVALTMFTSSTATLTILPVLLNIFKPSFIKNK